MSKLRLTLACGPYDRVGGIFSGAVPVEGVDLTPLPMPMPMEIFGRMLGNREFDVAEMALTHSFALTAAGTAGFVVLPVFPSRLFRHGFVFVNRASGIGSPKDLAGKRIGVQGYQMTAAVWIRGILRDQYGVRFDEVRWVEGGVNEPHVFGGDKTRLRPVRDIAVEHAPAGRTLSAMLADGEIDALIGAIVPDSMRDGGNVGRLFEDYQAEEIEYFRRTKIFPIMHALVIREEIHRANPWLATSLYKAFQQAKRQALAGMRFTGTSRYMLPWLCKHIEEIDRVFGPDPWPYGLTANRTALETFARYLEEEGFTSRRVALAEVFVPVEEIG